MQLRLEGSFRASHAAAQSTVRDAVQAISDRVDSAEASLVEARARLDEALDIHVANLQLIAPENIRQQIAELCEEGVHEALRSAQISFNAAVEEKAECHASLIEQRLWERVDDTQRQAQNAMTSRMRASEDQMQARLEALLAAASSHTDSSVTSLESKLGKKTIELCSTLERSMSKKVSMSVKSLEKKVNDRLDAAKVQILGEAHIQVLAAVAQMETRVSSLQHLVEAQQLVEADKDEVKEALAAQMERMHLSQKLSAEGLDDRIQRAIRDLEVRVEGTTRKQVNELERLQW
ncbi:hypothetical protein PHYSODRAFT_304335 [Phytophthora sojae]|uniref:Uncharacterized protein n=1 Tax=Phytophthora sojae (strain P6497) TaxID=1094619 RepID=G5A013_PHYSP|nr:hypothetical protein PHYSODRAFT_304335 [Phytophthora sojae]EGZ10455.1 hypothetical protein PHYSODRAFT_304335 [Phytophthora sojae]|eukprot:XP_009533200.1 hypothetical protein PHYSODRAFT_304335 [Phytophthora sojae]